MHFIAITYCVSICIFADDAMCFLEFYVHLVYLCNQKTKIIFMRITFLFLLTVATCATLHARSNNTEKVNVIPTKVGTKTEVTIPDVEYDPNDGCLSVDFKSDGKYTLSIADKENINKYVCSLNTTGQKTSYCVKFLEEGEYTVYLTSVETEYSGELEIK